MQGNYDPARYDAWYHSRRGRWIASQEFALLTRLLPPRTGETLLDVGCGSGQFSRRYQSLGLDVTGLDPQPAALRFARCHHAGEHWVAGSALCLPFAEGAFDVVVAITSLCFVAQPQQALEEMWRVSRRGVIVGLLNRHSLWYWRKRHHGGYRGARWDSLAEARAWGDELPGVRRFQWATALPATGDGSLARWLEHRLESFPWGGFLALSWQR